MAHAGAHQLDVCRYNFSHSDGLVDDWVQDVRGQMQAFQQSVVTSFHEEFQFHLRSFHLKLFAGQTN